MNSSNSLKRFIIAAAISFIFIILYEKFFPQAKVVPSTNETKTVVKADGNGSSTVSQTNKQNIASTNGIKSSNKLVKPIKGETISKITSKKFNAFLDYRGRISHFNLKSPRFKNGVLDLIGTNEPKPLDLTFADAKLNKLSAKTPYRASSSVVNLDDGAKSVTLTQNLGVLKVQKIITFYKDGNYNLNLKFSKKVKYYVTSGYQPTVDGFRMTAMESVFYRTDDKLDIVENGDAEEKYKNNILVAASSNRYYTTLFYSKKPFSVVIEPFNHGDEEDVPVVYLNASGNYTINGYIGEKDHDVLKKLDKKLLKVNQYGYFTFIAKPIFLVINFIHNYVGNWGWAIVLFTIFIRLLLYPFTYRGMVSMQKMKDLSPLIKEIQARYKGDPTKVQSHMMALYKKHKVNPIGGCLPLILQMPIFFAIYRVLIYSVELSGASWIFWISDLSVKDPYYILPLLMGLSMYLQQKVTPNSFNDPLQRKIFSMLPIVFVFISISFPAGLTLYWTVNNTLSILQQLAITKSLKKVGKIND